MKELSHIERMVLRKLEEQGVSIESSDLELHQAFREVVAPDLCYRTAQELRRRRRASKAIQPALL